MIMKSFVSEEKFSNKYSLQNVLEYATQTNHKSLKTKNSDL